MTKMKKENEKSCCMQREKRKIMSEPEWCGTAAGKHTKDLSVSADNGLGRPISLLSVIEGNRGSGTYTPSQFSTFISG